MTNTIQLTKIKTSYVHSLQQNKNLIDSNYYNKNITTQQLKQIVRDIIISTNDKSIENKSTSTKRFLSSLERQRTKDNIITLVYNSMLNGDGLGVI
jgi:hypothetical protein